jgi:hypothetical protein
MTFSATLLSRAGFVLRLFVGPAFDQAAATSFGTTQGSPTAKSFVGEEPLDAPVRILLYLLMLFL